jgi:hypothetical protein
MALRITTNAFDDEITGLINSALGDLGLVGISQASLNSADELVTTAIITYVKLHFGEPSDPDRLKKSYDEQKAQLITATGYGLG